MTASKAQFVVAALLLAGVVGSGAALVTTIHESRRLWQELEALHREQDRLQDDWSALRIEVSRLADHATIDRIARDELGFVDSELRREYAEVRP